VGARRTSKEERVRLGQHWLAKLGKGQSISTSSVMHSVRSWQKQILLLNTCPRRVFWKLQLKRFTHLRDLMLCKREHAFMHGKGSFREEANPSAKGRYVPLNAINLQGRVSTPAWFEKLVDRR